MDESIHLGTIGGVRVGANWSLLAVFALISWSLAAGQLPVEAPGYAPRAYWVVAVLTTVAFLAGLLAHELAHALLARRRGMNVKGIVLWLFGGVAQLEGDSPDARTELQVALAGPAASIGLAVAGGAAAWGLDRLGLSPLLVAAVAWLAAMNAVLGVFNLLPAFPLDGGRVLRAALWRHWDDRARATGVAASTGRIVGYGLMAAGAVELLAGGTLGGVWLGLIGWFVATAAGQQSARVGERARLQGLTVADAMSTSPVVVPAAASVAEVVDRYVRGGRFSAFPVGDAFGHIVGLTSYERMAGVPRDAWSDTPVAAASATPAEMVACTPDEDLGRAASRLQQSRDRRAVVVDGGRLVGILTLSDVGRAVRRASLVGWADPVRPGPAPRS